MGHLFGELIKGYLSQKTDFNQRALAYRSEQDEAVISKMLNGERLANLNARKRVLSIIEVLIDENILVYVEDADEILEAAGWSRLLTSREGDKKIIDRLEKKPLPIITTQHPEKNHQSPRNRFSLGRLILVVLVLGLALVAISNMKPDSQKRAICQQEGITCVGNGWCNAQPVETLTQNGSHYIFWDSDVNLDTQYYVYFDGMFLGAENVSGLLYDDQKDQWQFTITPQWIQSHLNWENSTLWRVDFRCA